MLKKLFYTTVMGIDGLVGMAIGVFALNTAGKWFMEIFDEGSAKAKQFIHEKTADKKENADEKA